MIPNAASLSHSEPQENVPGQNGGERESGVAKQGVRPGQSGDEGPTATTSRTDPDKAWTKRVANSRNTRGGHRTAGAHQDKRRTQGWPARPEGQQQEKKEDKTRTRSPDTEFRGVASSASVASYFS